MTVAEYLARNSNGLDKPTGYLSEHNKLDSGNRILNGYGIRFRPRLYQKQNESSGIPMKMSAKAEDLSDSSEPGYDDSAIQTEYKKLVRGGLYGSNLKRFIELRKSSDVKPRLSDEDLHAATQRDMVNDNGGAMHALLVCALTGTEPEFFNNIAKQHDDKNRIFGYDYYLQKAKKALGTNFTIDNIIKTGYGLKINDKPYDMVKSLNDLENFLGPQPQEITQYALQELVENGYARDVNFLREKTASRLELPENIAQELLTEYILNDELYRAETLKAAMDLVPSLPQHVVKKKISEYVGEGRIYDLDKFEDIAEVEINVEVEDIYKGMKTLLNKGDLKEFKNLGKMFGMEVSEDEIKLIGNIVGTKTEKSRDAKELLKNAVSKSETPEDIIKEYAVQKKHVEHIREGRINAPKSSTWFSRKDKHADYSDSLTKRTGIPPKLDEYLIVNTCTEFLKRGWYAEMEDLLKLSKVEIKGDKNRIVDPASNLRCEIQETYNGLWEVDKLDNMIELKNATSIGPRFVPYDDVQRRFKRYVQNGSLDKAEKLVRTFKNVGFNINLETTQECFEILIENNRYEDIPILEKLTGRRLPEQMIREDMNTNIRLGRYDRLERAVKSTNYKPDKEIVYKEHRYFAEAGMQKDLMKLRETSNIDLPDDVAQLLKDQKPHKRFAKRLSNGLKRTKEKFKSSGIVNYLQGAGTAVSAFYTSYNIFSLIQNWKGR